MEKKRVSDWLLGVMHWFLGGFLIPIAIFAAVMLITLPFVGLDENGNFVYSWMEYAFSIGFFAVGFAVTWIGARISMRLIKRKYAISNPRLILQVSTGIFFAISAAFAAYGLLDTSAPSYALAGAMSILDMLGQTAIFFFVTKKQLVA